MLMENPLFDSLSCLEDGVLFSGKENVFLIQMIKRNVPDEFDLMTQILNGLMVEKSLQTARRSTDRGI